MEIVVEELKDQGVNTEHDEVEVLVPNGLEGETKRLPTIVGMNIKC
jgi:hypothetical protein